MARSGARRKPKSKAQGRRLQPRGVSTGAPAAARPSARPEYAVAESAMFFPKLRRQAKWMFVFLALVFGLGFVVFGVGSGGGLGLDQIFQNLGTSSSGPSVGDAKDKIAKGNLAAYKDLSDAYRNQGKDDEAIAAGEKYLDAKPKDYDFMRTLAGDYQGKSRRLYDEASFIQAKLTAQTGGTTFGPPQNSQLGRALGQGRIDQELTTAANKRLTELYGEIQTANTRSTQLYKTVAAAEPEDVQLQFLVAESAEQAQDIPTALKAYRRVIKLAPDSLEAQQAQQQIALLKAQQQASQSSSR